MGGFESKEKRKFHALTFSQYFCYSIRFYFIDKNRLGMDLLDTIGVSRRINRGPDFKDWGKPSPKYGSNCVLLLAAVSCQSSICRKTGRIKEIQNLDVKFKSKWRQIDRTLFCVKQQKPNSSNTKVPFIGKNWPKETAARIFTFTKSPVFPPQNYLPSDATQSNVATKFIQKSYSKFLDSTCRLFTVPVNSLQYRSWQYLMSWIQFLSVLFYVESNTLFCGDLKFK